MISVGLKVGLVLTNALEVLDISLVNMAFECPSVYDP
jgi:hypothetical protein